LIAVAVKYRRPPDEQHQQLPAWPVSARRNVIQITDVPDLWSYVGLEKRRLWQPQTFPFPLFMFGIFFSPLTFPNVPGGQSLT
jgi:hypothetical protein